MPPNAIGYETQATMFLKLEMTMKAANIRWGVSGFGKQFLSAKSPAIAQFWYNHLVTFSVLYNI